MAKPFDATLKDLLEAYPNDWLALGGQQAAGDVEVIDAGLSTITAEADKVLRIHDPAPCVFHFELQASRDSGLVSRVLRYNVLLDYRHAVPPTS